MAPQPLAAGGHVQHHSGELPLPHNPCLSCTRIQIYGNRARRQPETVVVSPQVRWCACRSAGSLRMRHRGSAEAPSFHRYYWSPPLREFSPVFSCSPACPQAPTAPRNNLSPDAAPSFSVSLPQRYPCAVLSQPGGGCARRAAAPECRHKRRGCAWPCRRSSCPCHRPGPQQRRGRAPCHHQCGQLHQHQVRAAQTTPARALRDGP